MCGPHKFKINKDYQQHMAQILSPHTPLAPLQHPTKKLKLIIIYEQYKKELKTGKTIKLYK
jgi:hypothetical protein